MNILITGASGGIGGAIVRALAAPRTRLILSARNRARLQKLGGSLKNSGASFLVAPADMTRPATINPLVRAIAKSGRLDWAILCAGWIDLPGPIEKQPAAAIQKIYDSNLIGPALLSARLLPLIKPTGGIVLISSTAGITPNGRYAAYSSAKSGINALGKAIATAWKFEKDPRKIFIIAPGRTNTPMREKIENDAALSQSPDTIAKLIARLLAGRTKYRSGDVVVVTKNRNLRVDKIAE